MIWATVWTVLGLGALSVLFWLLRRLWRSAWALFGELTRFGESLSRLDGGSEDGAPTWVHPLLATDRDLEQLRMGLAQRKQLRGRRRHENQQKAYTRWSAWWG